MRISDWSSDVCSSDLVAAYAIQFRDGGYGIPVLVGRNDVYDRLAALGIADPHSFEVHTSVNSPLVPKMVEFLYQRQIGRASCRESMCQYGSIPVGAVSLKQKKLQSTQ